MMPDEIAFEACREALEGLKNNGEVIGVLANLIAAFERTVPPDLRDTFWQELRELSDHCIRTQSQ